MTMNFHRNRAETEEDGEQQAKAQPRTTPEPDSTATRPVPPAANPPAPNQDRTTRTPEPPSQRPEWAPDATAKTPEATKTPDATKTPEAAKTPDATKAAERATEQKSSDSSDTGTTTATGTTTSAATGTGGGPGDDLGQLNRRMERAIGDFVDDPRRAVREADAVLDEAAKRLTRMLEERRTSLRGTWHDDNGSKVGTEELRVALTHYRDMTRRLLNVT